jgi:NAD(P)-dependent dehydrogenase (short-subunit alcohol dehydrogenase family)
MQKKKHLKLNKEGTEMKKSIFLTGASSGIGKETAILFANKGWFVGIADVNEAGLDSLTRDY